MLVPSALLVTIIAIVVLLVVAAARADFALVDLINPCWLLGPLLLSLASIFLLELIDVFAF